MVKFKAQIDVLVLHCIVQNQQQHKLIIMYQEVLKDLFGYYSIVMSNEYEEAEDSFQIRGKFNTGFSPL